MRQAWRIVPGLRERALPKSALGKACDYLLHYWAPLTDGFQYTDATKVTWLWSVEPPPLGTNTEMFELVGSKDEDDYGNVSGTPDGLPSNSTLKIRTTDGIPFMQSVTNGLWYPIRITGVDGSATMEIGQTGSVSV